MTDFVFNSAVRSNVGLVRKNNQDSGYAGRNFLLIADGMGGHAGGDVASAIAVARLASLDHGDHTGESLDSLRSTILDANDRIARAVEDEPQLGGMGTTVTALLRCNDRLALAHIGDSRAYLLRDDSFSQMTTDHTFVQMLVDEGRITPEEAEYHPQRSVVMRVLGDVGASPELDMSVREARIGDRWMLCSDGLTGFADLDVIEEALRSIDDPGECAEKLVNMALEGGGADNITVVIGDVIDATDLTDEDLDAPGQFGGSVEINPQFAQLGTVDNDTQPVDGTQPVEDLETEALPQVDEDTAEVASNSRDDETPADGASDAGAGTATNSEKASDGAVEETAEAVSATAVGAAASSAAAVAGDSKRGGRGKARATKSRKRKDLGADTDDFDEFSDEEPRRRWIPWAIAGAVIVLLIVAGFAGKAFIQSQYYVTEENGKVAVYQGVSQNLGPFELSNLNETTDIEVQYLPAYTQSRLKETIPASSHDEAQKIVENLRSAADKTRQQSVSGGATDGNSTDPAPSAPGEPGNSPENNPEQQPGQPDQPNQPQQPAQQAEQGENP